MGRRVHPESVAFRARLEDIIRNAQGGVPTPREALVALGIEAQHGYDVWRGRARPTARELELLEGASLHCEPGPLGARGYLARKWVATWRSEESTSGG